VKLYLDNSFLNRPFDDPAIPRNQMEAVILRSIIELVESGQWDLIKSSVHAYENSLNPYPERKAYVEEMLSRANMYQNYTDTIAKRARELQREHGLTRYDARHVASAEIAKANAFITSDQALIKKYNGNLYVVDPITFFKKYDNINKT